MPDSHDKAGQEKVDLHGCEKLIFSDWSEEPSFLERVTIPDQQEAAAFLAHELCLGGAEEVSPEPIFMRWESAPPGKPFKTPDGFDYDGGWLECEADHPDAAPFWKDAP
jgi:hypothetical protein